MAMTMIPSFFDSTKGKILMLYGFVGFLWWIHSTLERNHYVVPKQSFWQFFIYVDYTRAFFYLILVPLYAFLQPQQAAQQWLLRILVVLLIQYQLDAISAFGTLYHSSCAPAIWRNFALLLNSVADPAFYCWILLVAHGWGTSLHTDLYYLTQWPIVLYGILQCARHLTDPVVVFEVRHLQCRLHSDWDKLAGMQDQLELDSLGALERDIEYLDLIVSLGFWIWCLHTTIRTIQQLTEEYQRQKYQYFLYTMVIFATVEQFALFIQLLSSLAWVSYKFYFTTIQLVQCLEMLLVATIAWLWRPNESEMEAQYNPLDSTPCNDEPFQLHYLELGVSVDESRMHVDNREGPNNDRRLYENAQLATE